MNDATVDDRVIGGTETLLAESSDTTTPVNRHLPNRPAWTCVVDGKPWPCAGARVHLRTAYADDRAGLAVYMSQELIAAAIDVADEDALPPDLFNRFMAWI